MTAGLVICSRSLLTISWSAFDSASGGAFFPTHTSGSGKIRVCATCSAQEHGGLKVGARTALSARSLIDLGFARTKLSALLSSRFFESVVAQEAVSALSVRPDSAAEITVNDTNNF